MNESQTTVLFCDGASKGNPGPAGWGLVLATPNQVIEAGGASASATNNQMELMALAEALDILESLQFSGFIRIYLDSRYVLEGASRYIHQWKKNSWRTKDGGAVKNQELWERIDRALVALGPSFKIEWLHVPGHQGISGNERADQIASGFASGNSPSLYRGDRSAYKVSLEVVRESYAKPVYVSLVEGQIFRDLDWKTCEARIKGRRGVKFKKVKNSLEEKELLKSWGRSISSD